MSDSVIGTGRGGFRFLGVPLSQNYITKSSLRSLISVPPLLLGPHCLLSFLLCETDSKAICKKKYLLSEKVTS